MVAGFRVNPQAPEPIWRQIELGVKRLVASGALARGAAVPSVREMARELRVNPNTVAKAYRRLADAGVLTVRRGEGTFVAVAPPEMAPGERRAVLHSAALRYAALTVTLGTSREEAGHVLEEAFDDLASEEGGRG